LTKGSTRLYNICCQKDDLFLIRRAGEWPSDLSEALYIFPFRNLFIAPRLVLGRVIVNHRNNGKRNVGIIPFWRMEQPFALFAIS
jgi:hypothetical protein